MKKISTLASPVLAGVVKAKSEREAIAEIKNCRYDDAKMIDLHMSHLENTSVECLRTIISSSPLPVLALNYGEKNDLSDEELFEKERVETFLRAVSAGAAGIDIQGYTYHLPSKKAFCGEDKYSFTKGNPKEVVTDQTIIDKQCELIERVHQMGSEVLLSCHPDIFMNCEQVVDLALFLEKRSPDIIKIVTVAHNEEELIESMRTMTVLKKEVKTPISYHSAGAAGRLSRVINPMLGGHIVFCVDRFSERSTMEQLDLRTAKSIVEGLEKIM